MNDGSPEDVEVSKRLSFVLRHKPESVGISLEDGGWVAVDLLLDRLNATGRTITRAMLERVVETSDKQRFALTEDRQRIRANQGHSVAVDLRLSPVRPPGNLFHGTATRFLQGIEREGLKPGHRQHVHLSVSAETAQSVGARRGKPVVLVVNAEAMFQNGFKFFLSANGVWFASHVPYTYLSVASEV
jgi:putative RNA 2'-phosphotransferase